MGSVSGRRGWVEFEIDEDLIVGQVDAIYFENPSNFYKVMRIRVDMDQTALLIDEEMVVTGYFAAIHPETTYQFFGSLTHHAKYGEQFAVTRYQQLMPTSKKGLVEYLSSDRFKGIGPKTATNIVDTLGEEAIEKILNDPASLGKVPGLSIKKADSLRSSLAKYQGTERVFMQLSDWGFGPKIAEKIYKLFKSQTLDKIKENPYQLVDLVEGVGFIKADQLAEQVGIAADSIDRVVAAFVMAVSQVANNEGDTFVALEDATKAARELLESSRDLLIDDQLLEEGFQLAVTQEKLLLVGEDLILPTIFYAEYGASKLIQTYMEHQAVEHYEEEEIDQAIEEVSELLKINYDELQRQALKRAIQSPMSIITGGPGTGKTTLVEGIIYVHAILHDYDLEDLNVDNLDSPIRLAAPTGRAAKRMQEAAGIPASTIHRLIGYNRESIANQFEPQTIDGSLLIVDEMSMVDVWLMNWLMQAVSYETQVVFVGDKDQLPSVGPGKVFADMIESQAIPQTVLQRIYRQAQNSSIIDLAHHVRQGDLPEDFLGKHADRSFIQCSPQQVPDAISQIVGAAVKKGFDAQSLQVLAPMYKGPAGINAINELMQDMLNPPAPKKREIKHFDRFLRVGDKVLQLVNNTEDGVYNGDIGKIEAIFTAKETESQSEEVIVSFEDIEITYKKSELDQLTLAYCCSIHKAQGSEYDLVILPLVDLYSRMLRRDIIYTAITRASKSLVLLGNPASFHRAVLKMQAPRQTKMKDYLDVLFENEASEGQPAAEKAGGADLAGSSTGMAEEDEDAATEADSQTETLLSSTASAIENIELTEETIWSIDPMIGMDDLSPYDFMPEKVELD